MKLVLLRHGETQWLSRNLFTGWANVDLNQTGIAEAKQAGQLLVHQDFDFDICYTSFLKRAIHTLDYVLQEMDRDWLPVIKDWHLNERHYGALQGLSKTEMIKKHGEAQVMLWRRSFSVVPPLLDLDDQRNPWNEPTYRNCKAQELPVGESLEMTIERVLPYFNSVIKPQIKSNKRVLIVAHGNSIRSLVKTFENLSNAQITKINIPTGVPLVYEFNSNMQFQTKYFLGDQKTIAQKIKNTKNLTISRSE